MSAYYKGSPQRREPRVSNRVINDPVAVIYNQASWRISKVTALYNLQYEAVKLKQYRASIKQALVNIVTTNSSLKYSVNVVGEPQLKYSEDDSDALMITVSSSSSSENSKSAVVYEAILLSWGMCNTVPEAIHLPYLLERGEQKVGTAVKTAFASIFDCRIIPFSFNQRQILQFAFNFIENETSNLDKPMKFIYSTPNVDTKDKLTLSFEIQDVYLILNSMKEEAKKRSELVFLTYQGLQNQIFDTFEFDIAVLNLHEVALPKASVKDNGTFKMKTPEMVNSVFTVLNEICTIDAV
ncbi:hypothetical protein JYU34_014368 [Plutella xylostella]|uniref:Centromere protein L n=1 Tax=Plutella xylostella TaxID=51655 RepID=A0ABQ7Q855_PLUXY|nr:uncharacterized protein LOC105389598 [Plutella xylostella]KAG7301421.1 hypothetical protein JYU34_014368 [Plutella xylostella]